MAKPKPLVQIISEKEFLDYLQEPSTQFFKLFNSFEKKRKEKKEISRQFYSNLIQEAQFLESFLDEYGARENRKWSFFTEYIASIRNLAIAAFYLKHILDRYPYYNLVEDQDKKDQFFERAREALEFLNRSIQNLYQEATQTARENGLDFSAESTPPWEFAEVQTNKRLPRNISEEQVKEEDDRIVDLFEKVKKVGAMMRELKINETDDLTELKRLVPRKIDEKRARMFTNLVHSVQSDFDTYIKNTRAEQDNQQLKNFRGYISMTLHLLEFVLWLCHFYERHEDEIRHGECKRKISLMVNKQELLKEIINFGFQFSLRFMEEAQRITDELWPLFVKTQQIELPIPEPLGFHARPCTYISLIARQHGEDLFLVVDGEKYNAKSVMSLLQAGGTISDKGYSKVVFEGSKAVLEDIKILAQHNYCEEKEIPKKLNYLKLMRNSA